MQAEFILEQTNSSLNGGSVIKLDVIVRQKYSLLLIIAIRKVFSYTKVNKYLKYAEETDT